MATKDRKYKRHQARLLDIRQSDIDAGIARDRYNCIGVRAIQRAIPDAMRVLVDTETMSWSVGNRRYYANTPDEFVQAVVKPLDTGHAEQIKPITITIAGIESKPVHKKKATTKVKARDNARHKKKQGTATNTRECKRFRPEEEPSFIRPKTDEEIYLTSK